MKTEIKTLIDSFIEMNRCRSWGLTESLRELIITIPDINDRFDAIDYAANTYGYII